MDARVQNMILAVLGHEGGYVNHPDDMGLATGAGGISQRAVAKIDRDGDGILDYDLDHDGDVDADDMRLFTLAMAIDFYETEYFERYKILDLPECIQSPFFDFAVNAGIGNSTRALQRSLTIRGFDAGAIDGILGSKTIIAAKLAVSKRIRKANSRVVNAFVTHRLEYYLKVVRNKPKQSVFLDGWINRSIKFMEAI